MRIARLSESGHLSRVVQGYSISVGGNPQAQYSKQLIFIPSKVLPLCRPNIWSRIPLSGLHTGRYVHMKVV